MFINFTNFYQHFIQNFSKIATQLISMLKTIESSKKLTFKTFRSNKNKVVRGNSNGRANKMVRK